MERKIITVEVLKSLPNLTPDILRRLMECYALPYEDAVDELTCLSIDLREEVGEDQDPWINFRNALVHMVPSERDRLREQCQKELG
jgi:hypothetical protein